MRLLRFDIWTALPPLLLIMVLSGCGVVDSAGEGINEAPSVSISDPGTSPDTGGGGGDGGSGGEPGVDPNALRAREQDRVTLSGAVVDDFNRVDQVKWEQVFPATRASGISSLKVDLQDADQIDAWFIAPSVEEPTAVRFRFTAIDNFGTQGSAEVDVVIRSIAVADARSVAEDSSANTLDVLSNDNAAASSSELRIVSAGTAGHGAVSVQGSDTGNTLIYVPDADYEGIDKFEYTVIDAEGKADTAKVQVTVTHAGDAPVLTNPGTQGSAAGMPIQPLQIKVSDVDPGETFRFAAANLPPNLVINPNSGTITGTTIDPGIYAVTVTVTDADGLKASTTFSWEVSNNPPTAVPDTNQVTEDAVPDTVTGNLRVNDFDGEDANAQLIVTEVAGSLTPGQVNGIYGMLVWTADGSYSYSLDNARVATDQLTAADTVTDVFNYLVTDTDGGSGNAALTVTVNGTNDVPTAVADAFTVSEDSTNNLLNVLANDVDPDLGDTREVVSLSTPSRDGTVKLSAPGADNAVIYTPDPDFFGTETFDYTMRDAAGETSSARVTVTVSKVNDLPVTEDLSFEIDEDQTLEDSLSATDEDNDPLEFSIVSQGSLGRTEVLNTATGRFRYVPDPGKSGGDSFTYKVNDGTDDSNTSTVSITILAVNDAPVASDSSFSTPQGATFSGSLTASDSDGDNITFSLTGQGAKGTAVIDSQTGEFSYTPGIGQTGSDSFKFNASDGELISNTATVNVTITNVNDPPLANPGSFSVDEDSVLTDSLSASDVDGDPLIYSIVSNAGKGLATITNASSGAFRYVPASDANGSDSFSFRVSDGVLDSNTATVLITITSVNDAPVAEDLSVDTQENQTVSGTLKGSDIDSGSLTYSIVTNGTRGNATVTSPATGAFSYTPNAGVSGSDGFTYRVNDGTADSNVATVTVDISAVNDKPRLDSSLPDQNATEDTAFSFTFAANAFSDPDGDPLSYTATQTNGSPLPGWLNFSGPSRSFTGTPGEGDAGSVQVRMTASDPSGESASDTFSISVTAVNDAPTSSGIGDVDVDEGTVDTTVVLTSSFDDEEDGADGLTYSVQSNSTPALFSSVVVSGGSLTLTYASGQTGSSDLTIRATDSGSPGLSVEAGFTVTVNPAGGVANLAFALEPPGQCWITPRDVVLRSSLATGQDSQDAVYALVTDGAGGSVAIIDPAAGAFEYVAKPGIQAGEDSFTYSVEDPAGGVETRSATVVVQQAIMALGDEITEGVSDAEAQLPTVGERVGYRGPLALALSSAGYEVDFVGTLEAGGSVGGADPAHEGHLGATAYDVAFGSPDASGGVYAWLEANPADVVLLHIGTHGLSSSPADVGFVLDEIDRWEASEGGHPVSVLLARIIDQVPAHPDVALFNDNIAALAVARKTDPTNLAYPDDVTVVNLNGALNYPQDIEDGVHPDRTGYANMADVWFTALTQGRTAVLDKCP